MQLPFSLGLSTLQVAQGAATTWSDHCADFPEDLALPSSSLQFAETVSAGTVLKFPDANPACSRPQQQVNVDICRVSVVVKTGPASNVSLEAWLPFNWTGRFLSSGNGGLGGCILYEDLSFAVANGFAAVSTNAGHNDPTGKAFYRNMGVIEDFAYRSVRIGASIGKQITKAFYGKEHQKSYFIGCSYGGHQGFKSAQDYPDDFDGIIVGAPSISFPNLTSWRGHFLPVLGTPGDDRYLTPELWSLVQSDVMNQCDLLDGLADGIIEDPSLCQYRPEVLLCEAGKQEGCLTPAQVSTVRSVYSPLYGNNGSLIYPRLPPGVSRGPLFSAEPFPYTLGWFKYAVYNDPSWDPKTIGPRDYEASARFNPFDIEAWNGNLSAAKDRGAKILHYHGLQDSKVSSEISMQYYKHVSKTMATGSDGLDDFYRYFRISGMDHCFEGPGATVIGNYEHNSYEGAPSGNMLDIIVNWVEKDVAPDTLLGVHYVQGTKEVEFQRRHCRYPFRNEYAGVGDPTDPNSWKCVGGHV